MNISEALISFDDNQSNLSVTSWLKNIFNPIYGAARRFRKERADYYETLADRMDNAKGKTLRDFFESDAVRYAEDEAGKSTKSARAILSAVWADRYDRYAGDLAVVFQGTIPNEDLALIRLGQSAGSEALADSFRDLARVSALIQQAKNEFFTSISVGVLAMLVVVFDLIIIPAFSAPMLLEFFKIIPPSDYPKTAARFFSFADFLSSYLILILALVGGAIWSVQWSLPNLVGPFRVKLDKWLIWKLYRDFQGALFVATLATVIKYRGGSSVSLDTALEQLRHAANPWLAWHIGKMIEKRSNVAISGVADSEAVARTLDTGLIERETMWYLLDVQQGVGISEGLQKTGRRIEGPTLKKIMNRAITVRWILLITAIGISIGLAFWQREVVNVMIQTLKNFYSK